MDYGAVADGITDDSAAFTAAAAAANCILVPAGTYLKNTQTNISSNQTWILDSATIKQTGTSTIMFSASNVSDWAIIGNGVLQGSGAGGPLSECLMYAAGGKRGRVVNLTCKNSSGWGFKRDPGTFATPRGDMNQYVNCSGYSNYYGMECTAGSGAEYSTWTNCNFTSNTFGAAIEAGNITLSGGNIVDNINGLYLGPGTNHGHGICSGVSINHNTNYNLKADTITNGYVFSGCRFYADSTITGYVWLNASQGISIIGGILDSVIKNDAVAGVNLIVDNLLPSATGQTPPTGSSGAASLVLFNYSASGLWQYNTVGQRFVGAAGATWEVGSTGSNTLDRAIKFTDSVGSIASDFATTPNTVGTSSVVNLYVGGNAASDITQTWNDDQTVKTYNSATQQTTNGAQWIQGQIYESITLSTGGSTTDSATNLLPANSVLIGVTARVTTTIATATDWKLGDATTAGRFTAANSTLTAGTTSVGSVHLTTGIASTTTGMFQAAAAKLRITTTGTPSAGVIRVTVFYSQFVPPTS